MEECYEYAFDEQTVKYIYLPAHLSVCYVCTILQVSLKRLYGKLLF
jgi:hypothetical protein